MRRYVWIAAAALVACAGPQQAQKGTGPTGGTQGGTVQQPEVSNRAKLLFDEAVEAWKTQKKARAVDYPMLERKFQAALDADRDLAEAEYNLGVIAERQGKTQDAVSRYRAALKKKPTLKEAAENLAVIAQNQGDVGGAIEIYKGILDRSPEDASSRARLAEIYRRQSDHDRAMELAREALIRDPQQLRAHKVMMRSYVDRKQLAMAKLVALRALKIDDRDPELYHTIGLILLAEKDPVQARIQFGKAVEASPDYLPSHVELARIALQLEDYEAAEQHLRRILQANGKNAEAHLNLGVAYKGLGQFDKAMLEYDEAEKLNPQLSAVYLNRAILLHRHKDAPERALELYKKYLTMTGAGTIDDESPVMGLVKEAETLIQAKKEAAAAEAEAKKMEAEAAKQQQQGGTQPASGEQPAPGATQPAGGAAPEAKPQPAPAKQTAPAPQAKDEPEPGDEPSDDL